MSAGRMMGFIIDLYLNIWLNPSFFRLTGLIDLLYVRNNKLKVTDFSSVLYGL